MVSLERFLRIPHRGSKQLLKSRRAKALYIPMGVEEADGLLEWDHQWKTVAGLDLFPYLEANFVQVLVPSFTSNPEAVDWPLAFFIAITHLAVILTNINFPCK